MHEEVVALPVVEPEVAEELLVPGRQLELVQQVKREGRLPVVNFAAGGVATPADAALTDPGLRPTLSLAERDRRHDGLRALMRAVSKSLARIGEAALLAVKAGVNIALPEPDC